MKCNQKCVPSLLLSKRRDPIIGSQEESNLSAGRCKRRPTLRIYAHSPKLEPGIPEPIYANVVTVPQMAINNPWRQRFQIPPWRRRTHSLLTHIVALWFKTDAGLMGDSGIRSSLRPCLFRREDGLGRPGLQRNEQEATPITETRAT